MRTWTLVVAVMLGLWGTSLNGEETKFAGNWEATFGGKVFLILKLHAGNKISGTLNAGGFTLDENGELVEVRPVEDREAPIFFASSEGDKLEFDFQDDDNEVTHFELTLVNEDKAELRVVDKHNPKMKAFPLRRK